MAVRTRSDNAAHVRSRRVYSAYTTRHVDNPLDTLLHLVALNGDQRAPAEQLQPSKDDLKEFISALYRVATENFDRTQVLTFAASRACSMTNATGAVIALKQGGEFVSTSMAGGSAPALGARFSSDTGISGECVRTATILRCDDTENDARVNAQASRALGVRSLVAVPIFGRGEVVGLLEVFGARPGVFDEQHTYLLQLVSALVSHALGSDAPAEALQDRARRTPSLSAANEPLAEPLLVPNSIEAARPFSLGLRIAAGLVVSAALFAGIWVSIPRSDIAGTQAQQPIANATPMKAAGAAGTSVAQSAAVPAQISGVEFKSHGDFTAVKVNLDRRIMQQSGRLRNPNRVYFDLFDSDLAGKFKGEKVATINVDDAYVRRIRLAQGLQHRTRIVLDLNCACEYTAVLPDRAPYGLAILVQPLPATNKNSTVASKMFVTPRPSRTGHPTPSAQWSRSAFK